MYALFHVLRIGLTKVFRGLEAFVLLDVTGVSFKTSDSIILRSTKDGQRLTITLTSTELLDAAGDIYAIATTERTLHEATNEANHG